VFDSAEMEKNLLWDPGKIFVTQDLTAHAITAAVMPKQQQYQQQLLLPAAAATVKLLLLP